MIADLVVFLGPTLPRAEASALLDAQYVPPAEQGDVVRAVREMGAKTIVLIDGVFAGAPAVRHKEILWALSQGVAVHGAASMGALRAAELHSYGMRGHGLIYRWYRATHLADDDDVAVAMMPRELGSASLSDALVSIRVTLRAAERKGVIAQALRHHLETLARELHFIERSYDTLFDRAYAKKLGDPPTLNALRAWIARNARDQKGEDARSLLRFMASGPGGGDKRLPQPAAFRVTEAWAYDLDSSGLSLRDIRAD